MKHIPSPKELDSFSLDGSATHQRRVEVIVDRFITACKTSDFIFSDQRTHTVMFPVNEDYSKDAAFADAIKRLKEAGWQVHHTHHGSAMGWFHAIIWEP